MSVFREKKFWLLTLLIIIISFLIYWLLSQKPVVPPEYQYDKMPPISKILSPENYSWQNSDFIVKVFDEDLESGLKDCSFYVSFYDTKKGARIAVSNWLELKRECNKPLTITTGPDGMCRGEGEIANGCWIYISSRDQALNQHEPFLNKELGEGSIRIFNIDWTSPTFSKIYIAPKLEEQMYPILIEEKKNYIFKADVKDDFKIIGCSLFVNAKDEGVMSLEPAGCSRKCLASKSLVIPQKGEYKLVVQCQDSAGNSRAGEQILAKTK